MSECQLFPPHEGYLFFVDAGFSLTNSLYVNFADKQSHLRSHIKLNVHIHNCEICVLVCNY